MLLALVQLLLTAAAAASPSVGDVPVSLMQSAECMAAIARATPGVTDVRINASSGSGAAYPILEFRSADESGRRRFTELMLFEISGAVDNFVFDKADIEGDPVANKLVPAWRRRCQAGPGVITSEPGP